MIMKRSVSSVVGSSIIKLQNIFLAPCLVYLMIFLLSNFLSVRSLIPYIEDAARVQTPGLARIVYPSPNQVLTHAARAAARRALVRAKYILLM